MTGSTKGPTQWFCVFFWPEASESEHRVTSATPGPTQPSQAGHPLCLLLPLGNLLLEQDIGIEIVIYLRNMKMPFLLAKGVKNV